MHHFQNPLKFVLANNRSPKIVFFMLKIFIFSLSLSLSLHAPSYGHSLVLVASQEVRERALVPLTKSPPDDISDIQYCLLEVVGCSRHYGTCRPYITNKYFKIDARSLYHHCKELKKHGLIVVKASIQNTVDREFFAIKNFLLTTFSGEN